MVEYLEQLLQEKRYEQVVRLAERVLLNPESSKKELLLVNIALLESRLYLSEIHGARVAGQVALRLTRELADWDAHGKVCYYLGEVYLRTGSPEMALSLVYEYLEHVHQYSKSLPLHSYMWQFLGHLYKLNREWNQAESAIRRGMDVALHSEDIAAVQSARNHLIDLFIRSEQLERVPRLLAESLHYLHQVKNPRYGYHFTLRCEYAMKTNRLKRARRVGLRGLRLVSDPIPRFVLLMNLAAVSLQEQNTKDALAYALLARVIAIRAKAFDLESRAADFVYRCTQLDPAAVNIDLNRLPNLSRFFVTEWKQHI